MSTDSPTADWQHTIETLFKASTPSATLSAQLTSLLDNYAPHDLAATLAAAASHIRQHATQPTTHVEWLTQLGMLKVPLLLGEGSAIHTTATHAMATAALQLHALGKHEHQQEALRLCGHLLAHTALVEAQHHAVAGYTLGFLLEHLHNPLPLVRDIVDTWSIAVSDDPTRQLLVQLLQSTALLPLLHSKLRTKDDDGSAAAYCQLWDIVTQRAVVLGMTLDPMSSFSALQCIMRAMRRGMLRLQEAPAAHWPPYTVVCFTHMANAAARAAHHCREVLVGTDHAQTSGAVLACLAEQLLLPAENAATADGLALASALLHAALQLSGARVAFSAQRGVESLFRVLMRCYAVMCAASQDACMAGVLSCRLLELEAKFCMLWVMLVGSVEATMPSTGAYQQGCPEVTAWKAVWEDGEGQLDAMQPFWHGVQRSGFLAFLQSTLLCAQPAPPPPTPTKTNQDQPADPLHLLSNLSIMLVMRSRQDWHVAAASSMSFQQRVGYSAKDCAELADVEQLVMAISKSSAEWPPCCASAAAFVPLLVNVDRNSRGGSSVRYSLPTTLPFVCARSDASDVSMATHSSDM